MTATERSSGSHPPDAAAGAGRWIDSPGPVVEYKHYLWSWQQYGPFLADLIDRFHVRSVCEVGAGANPALSLRDLDAFGVSYAALDLSAEELAKAPCGYEKIVADIGARGFASDKQYDLVISRMLAEHVPEGHVFHSNVRALLRPEGIAFHWYPTLGNLPMLVNKYLPDRLCNMVLQRYSPVDRRSDGPTGKFPARYSMCLGPCARQLRNFENMGFDVLRFVGFFGHGYYKRLPMLHRVHDATVAALLRHPVARLTSSAFVVLRRRGMAAECMVPSSHERSAPR